MKLALLLFGMSKMEYVHWSMQDEKEKKKCKVDYEKSYENYKKFIFDFFENKGYDIDVYFTTNILDNKDKKKICEKYKPIKYNFIKNDKNIKKSRNQKLNNVIDLCLNSGFTYDLILITRFDLLFQKEFDKSNIDFDKFNIVSILERQNLICDNFYLFPYKYFQIFSNIVKQNLNKSFHCIQKDLYNKLNITSVNYILNENRKIKSLSFYKIVRNFNVK